MWTEYKHPNICILQTRWRRGYLDALGVIRTASFSLSMVRIRIPASALAKYPNHPYSWYMLENVFLFISFYSFIFSLFILFFNVLIIHIGLSIHCGSQSKFHIHLYIFGVLGKPEYLKESHANTGRTYKLHKDVVLGEIGIQDPSAQPIVLVPLYKKRSFEDEPFPHVQHGQTWFWISMEVDARLLWCHW